MLARRSHCFTCHKHEPYLTLLLSFFGWYSLRLPTEGWPGWVDLGGWLYTEIDFQHRKLNPGPVTHPSTNRARCRVISLIETNMLPTTRPTANHKGASRFQVTTQDCNTEDHYSTIRGIETLYLCVNLVDLDHAVHDINRLERPVMEKS